MKKHVLITLTMICLLSLLFAGTSPAAQKAAATASAAAKTAAAATATTAKAATVLNESYRIVKVYQMDGLVSLDRGGSVSAVYVGMNLKTGDTVTVGKNSHLYLKVDNDKYLMAEPDTVFTLEFSGTQKESKTKILLKAGNVVSRVDQKLDKNASYEVTTSASTMAVRGTLVKTGFLPAPTGGGSTTCTVFEGTATLTPAGQNSVNLVTELYGSPSMPVPAGTVVSLSQGADGTIAAPLPAEIDYKEQSLSVLQFLAESTETGRKLSIDMTQLNQLITEKEILQKQEAEKQAQQKQNSSSDDPTPTPTPEPDDPTDKAQNVTPKSRGTAEDLPEKTATLEQ